MEIDEQLIRDCCARIAKGAFPHQALVSCGVPSHEASLWLAEGRRQFEGHVSPDESLHVRLVAACDIAEADLQEKWIQFVLEEQKGWQRFEALLEKRWPDRYLERKSSPPYGPKAKDKRKLEDILDDINREEAAKRGAADDAA